MPPGLPRHHGPTCRHGATNPSGDRASAGQKRRNQLNASGGEIKFNFRCPRGHPRGVKPPLRCHRDVSGAVSFWCGEPGVQLDSGAPQHHCLSLPFRGSTYTKIAVAGHLAWVTIAWSRQSPVVGVLPFASSQLLMSMPSRSASRARSSRASRTLVLSSAPMTVDRHAPRALGWGSAQLRSAFARFVSHSFHRGVPG